ncbi:pentapeptide repeat-containing protein [Psychrobacter sp. SHUES1]|uniref:pentapeptide repeat-containing protein n=1 Tax=Psychrobacter sp. SHUES1 TaxID=1849383 RepID=UPI0007F49D77|nr:pentapeptide repeat-containing protein [Psychrobacter sp. SHUES1]OAP66876.1 hypothetical protein A7325_08620 [Psychrobacter sp. SHUES1]
MKTTIFILIALAFITILITGFWGIVSDTIFPSSTWGLYDKEFFEDLLVGIHGGIIDLLIVGVVLYWFDIRRAKNDSIEEAENDLANLEYYSGSDASFKFYGYVRYLAALGVNKVKMSNGKLSDLNIKSLELADSNLIGVDFSRSTLKDVTLKNCQLQAAQFIDTKIRKCIFQNSNLERAKFIKAELKSINFEGCNIKGATFKDCELQSAIFKGVDCKGVSFKGCNLRSANFLTATNITREMILESSNYKSVKLPEGIVI